jgi:hypothetical protein
MGIQDHIKLDDLYTQLAGAFIIFIIGWVTGGFRFLWRVVTGSARRGIKIKRNTAYVGWYTYAKQEEIEYAFGKPNYMVSIFIKTRWWITNYSEQPLLISEAYFLAQRPDQGKQSKKLPCQGCARVSETGELVPTSLIEKTQQVELDAMLDTTYLNDEGVVVGLFVLVDQTGREYRTEMLKHRQVSRYR